MKRLAVIAAAIALAGCKHPDNESTHRIAIAERAVIVILSPDEQPANCRPGASRVMEIDTGNLICAVPQ